MLVEIRGHWMIEEVGNERPPRQTGTTGRAGGRHLGDI